MDFRLLFIIIVWVILAIIFAFTDLEISKTVADPSNEVARFGAVHGTYPAIIMVIISFIIIFINIMVCIVKKEIYISYLSKIALIVIILYIINPVVFVTITKNMWGRVRFVHLYSDYSNYTPWYVINGNNGNVSFTSYHSAMGWMFLPLVIKIKDMKWQFKYVGFSLVIGWGLFISISRVFIGAHYASDVLFPTMIAFMTTYLFIKLFRKEQEMAI